MYLSEDLWYEVEAATEQWTDSRVVNQEDLEHLLFFWYYMPKAFSQNKMKFLGCVFRQKGDQWLMTVKAKENSTPLVVFVTSGTTTGCMRRFISLVEDDRVAWVRDKYPWI